MEKSFWLNALIEENFCTGLYAEINNGQIEESVEKTNQ